MSKFKSGQRSKARFAATIALQKPAHPRASGNSRCSPDGEIGPGAPFSLKGAPANTTARKCAHRPQREQRAADEFTRWRTEHPNATADDLRHHWRKIQVDWNLSAPERTP